MLELFLKSGFKRDVKYSYSYNFKEIGCNNFDSSFYPLILILVVIFVHFNHLKSMQKKYIWDGVSDSSARWITPT